MVGAGTFLLEMGGRQEWRVGGGGGGFIMKDAKFLVSLHNCPIPSPSLPCHLQPRPQLFFLLSCFFGWMGDHATFDVLFYLMIIWPWYQKDLDVCFMQQGVRFTEVWHIMWLLVPRFDITNAQTHYTQGPLDWHTHQNVYLYHLLCAQMSYLYYIKWLNKWLNE